MTTRLLMLPAVLFVATGCSNPDATMVADDLPQAPAPRAKKTTAELLVGKWKMEKSSHTKLGPDVDIRIEFAADGKYFTRSEQPYLGVQQKSGTYLVEGHILTLTPESDKVISEAVREVTIVEINEEEFKVTLAPHQWDVFRRVKAN